MSFPINMLSLCRSATLLWLGFTINTACSSGSLCKDLSQTPIHHIKVAVSLPRKPSNHVYTNKNK